MTNADRLQRWNLWYERTPELWRFQLIVWALLAVGAVNMLLTIIVGFPFALLVGIAVLAIAAVRVPYVLGWVRADGSDAAAGARLEIEAPSWVVRANRWYDGLTEMQRPLVLLALLAIPGAINMLLTFAGGFPFGLLFLIAVLALMAIRAPYTAGWLKESPVSGDASALTMDAAPPRIGGGQDAPLGSARPDAEAVPVGGEENQPAGARSRATNGGRAPSGEAKASDPSI